MCVLFLLCDFFEVDRLATTGRSTPKQALMRRMDLLKTASMAKMIRMMTMMTVKSCAKFIGGLGKGVLKFFTMTNFNKKPLPVLFIYNASLTSPL